MLQSPSLLLSIAFPHSLPTKGTLPLHWALFVFNLYCSFSSYNTYLRYLYILCLFLSLQVNYRFLGFKTCIFFFSKVVSATRTTLVYSINIGQINKILSIHLTRYHSNDTFCNSNITFYTKNIQRYVVSPCVTDKTLWNGIDSDL